MDFILSKDRLFGFGKPCYIDRAKLVYLNAMHVPGMGETSSVGLIVGLLKET